jgi:hypothetical protein
MEKCGPGDREETPRGLLQLCYCVDGIAPPPVNSAPCLPWGIPECGLTRCTARAPGCLQSSLPRFFR